MQLKFKIGVASACHYAFVLLLSASIFLILQSTDQIGLVADELISNDASVDKSTEPSLLVDKPEEAQYISPKLEKSDDLFLYESFDDEKKFEANWIPSKDPKYKGKWQLDQSSNRPSNDKSLLLPLKARFYGISAKLDKPFEFSSEDKKPLVIQYEVEFRDILDCGGAYMKLIRDANLQDLSQLTDKTPFTIMFGPDRCGGDTKLHFIVQYPNPKTNEYEEKHWEKSKFSVPLSVFSDKQAHLFKLILKPDNDFEVFVDDVSVGTGNLLNDLKPAINPPKEIIDENDTKPEDWDERAQIDDPNAVKPDDWDENQPRYISDPDAKIPSDWLTDVPQYIPDENSKKPDDWEDMDGEWEPPLIENPACSGVSGCGPWKAPHVDNPAYKGIWKAPKIDNPNYKGIWEPRKIPNPDYFFDASPFQSLEPIYAVSFELWSMADNIAFDNVLITRDEATARLIKSVTWDKKKPVVQAKPLLDTITDFTKDSPIFSIFTSIIGIMVFYGLITFIRRRKVGSSRGQDIIRSKKLDESRPDDPDVDGDHQDQGSEDEKEEEVDKETSDKAEN